MARMFWIDSLINSDVTDGGQVVLSLAGLTSESVIRQDALTLTRTIIGLTCAYTVHDAGEGSQGIFLGTGICSQQAFAGGATSHASVMVEFPTRGWVWRAGYRVFGFAADQPAVFAQRIDVDLRGQRKLENGVSFLHMDNIAIEGVGASVRVLGLVRQLWKSA